MSADWPVVRLGDHIESSLGKMLDQKKNKGIEKPYLGNSNVRWGYFDLTDLSKMKFEDSESERYGIKSGDLIVCEGGEPGRCAIWKEYVPGMKIQKALHRIRPKPTLNNYFLYYWFLLAGIRGTLEPYFTGTTIKHLTGKALKELEIQLPPLKYQEYVACVLKSLDDKIDFNRQINQTLEQIAQALFKSWFVDFDPVKAKITALGAGGSAEDAELAAMGVIAAKTPEELAELKQTKPETYQNLAQIASLFPSTMQESELGEIPEGWRHTTFGEVSVCFDSKRIPLSKREREKKQPGNIPYYGATSIMDYVNDWLFDDVYLLLGEDGSVVKDDGTPFVQYIWGKSWVNNHAHILQGKNGISTEQLMVFIKNTNIASYVTGAVQLKLNQRNMNSIPFLRADDSVNAAFQRQVSGIYEIVKNNAEENITLTVLRDSLLPRLLTGEIAINSNGVA